MVVFVDVNLREIHIYSDNGIKKIPFHDARLLPTVIGEGKVNYVANIIETNAEEVINLVKGLSGQQPVDQNQRVIDPDLEVIKEDFYLHSISNGTLLIPDLDDKPAPGEKGHIQKALIRFEGIGDCKMFDDNLKEIIKKSPLFRSLIKQGKIEMVGEQRKNELMAVMKSQMAKKLAQSSARDASLDDIIMDGKVGDWNGEITVGDNAIEIDVGSPGFGSRGGGDSHGASSMSDLMGMIDGTA